MSGANEGQLDVLVRPFDFGNTAEWQRRAEISAALLKLEDNAQAARNCLTRLREGGDKDEGMGDTSRQLALWALQDIRDAVAVLWPNTD